MSCELKVRLPSGETVTGNYDPTDRLSLVKFAIASHIGYENFLFSVPYPRKVFTDSELESTTLEQAGLAPRGLLILQNSVSTEVIQGQGPIAPTGVVTEIASVQQYESLKGLMGKLIVVDCFATWCGPCVHLAPLLKKLAEKYSGVVFLKVDAEKFSSLPDMGDVRAYPTIKFFKNGNEVHKVVGADINAIESGVRNLQ